jgi:hypothetical protein
MWNKLTSTENSTTSDMIELLLAPLVIVELPSGEIPFVTGAEFELGEFDVPEEPGAPLELGEEPANVPHSILTVSVCGNVKNRFQVYSTITAFPSTDRLFMVVATAPSHGCVVLQTRSALKSKLHVSSDN